MSEDPKPKVDKLEVDIKSVAIQRIIDEIKLEQENGVHPNAYNRVYSRHNRS